MVYTVKIHTKDCSVNYLRIEIYSADSKHYTFIYYSIGLKAERKEKKVGWSPIGYIKRYLR